MKTAFLKSVDLDAHGVDDVELAKRAGAGDMAAFEALMRRHNRLLFRTARSVLRNDDDTEDVLQEAYLRAWCAFAGFRAESKVSTWLVRIVLNEALGRLRRRGAQVIPIDASVLVEAQSDATHMEDDPDHEPERVAMRSELRALMEKRIDALPDVFRTVFMLRAVEEMSVEETACALEIPEATVRTRFFRARSLLREGLSRDVDFAIGDAFAFAGARCDRIVASVRERISEGRDGPRSCPPTPGEE
ncbi:MAG: RNA polymerase sigma factor [Pseudomonadota bacterium]|nr:RNA polymerase sigma factor [Pseudomonadota bacterium]